MLFIFFCSDNLYAQVSTNLKDSILKHNEENKYDLLIPEVDSLMKELDQEGYQDTIVMLVIHTMQARAFVNLGQIDRLIALYEQYSKCNICHSERGIQWLADLNQWSANNLIQQGRIKDSYDLSISMINELTLFKNSELLSYILSFRFMAALACRKLGDIDQALKIYSEIENDPQLKSIITEKDRAEILTDKAEIYRGLNDLVSAKEFALKAQGIYANLYSSESNSNSITLGYCHILRILSVIAIDQKNCFEAINLSKKVVDISEEFQLAPYFISSSYFLLADSFGECGDQEQELFYSEKGYLLCKKELGENHPTTLNFQIKYGGVLFEQDIISGIKKLSEIAYKIDKLDLIDADNIKVFKSFGRAYFLNSNPMKNLDSSLFYFQRVASLSEQLFGNESSEFAQSQYDLGITFFIREDFGKAFETTEISRKLIVQFYGKEYHLYKGILSSQIRNLSYLGRFHEAEMLYLELNELWVDYVQRNYLAIVSFSQSQDELLSHFEDYNRFIVMYAAKLKKVETLKAACNNMLLIKNLQLSGISSIKKELSVNKELKRKYDRVLELSQQVILDDRFQIEKSTLEKELIENSGAFRSLKEGVMLKTQNISQALEQGEVAIEFSRYFDDLKNDYRYLAFLIKPGNPEPFLMFTDTEGNIENAIENMDFQLLYKYIWKPLESLIPAETKVIYISAIGALNHVAFNALCVDQGQSDTVQVIRSTRGANAENVTRNTECNFLIDRYQIKQLSSLRKLIEQNSGNLKTKPSIYLVGGIDYEEVSQSEKEEQSDLLLSIENVLQENYFFTPLPGTVFETNEIEQKCKNGKWLVKTKYGSEAVENELTSQLNESNFTVIHIATHGFSLPDELSQGTVTGRLAEPLERCGVALAGANISKGKYFTDIKNNPDDGLLLGSEVAELNLSNTSLVVLSACETGLGNLKGIEGSSSVGRAFLLAGVDYVISSLWPVPDKETSELMIHFYEKLIATKDIELSFEYAQIEMLKKYPTTPSVWAGFVLLR